MLESMNVTQWWPGTHTARPRGGNTGEVEWGSTWGGGDAGMWRGAGYPGSRTS